LTIEFDTGIADQLLQVTTTSSVQIRVGTSNSNLVIASTLMPLLHEFQMGGVYISASQAAPDIISMMDGIGIETGPIQFIDCVSSGVIGGTQSDHPNISFIDSPIMLESMMLRTLYWLETAPHEQNFVILDSVNALSIYNDERMLAEYLHTFINTYRSRSVLSLIVNVPDQTPAGVLANLDLYCTDLVDRGQVLIS